MKYIESADNKLFTEAKKLLIKKHRDASGHFLIEGQRLVFDAIKNGAEVKTVFVNESFDASKLSKDKTVILKDKLFLSLAQTKTPQGIIAVAKKPKASLEGIDFKGISIICEAVSDPGNLGTIIRTADALGADAVILTNNCVDPYNQKVIRSTMASIFNVSIVIENDLEKLFSFLKEKGVKVFCGALTDKSEGLYEKKASTPLALLVGNEASGVSPLAMSLSDACIKIPMRGKCESLNAAVAISVMAYEFYRKLFME